MIVPWVSEDAKDSADIDLHEAYAYYLTPRGQHKNSDNKLRFVSMANMMAFDALNFVDTLLSQPIQIIIGDKPGAFGSMNLGRKLFELATASKEKDLLVIEGACHYDLYDDPKTTDIASAKLSDFFHKHL